MNADKIKKIQNLNNEIDNFRECYRGIELWGDQDGCVSYDKLLSFLIENTHFQKIADEIKKLETIT